MRKNPESGWMHVDTRFITVCATCMYWNDPFGEHLAFSNSPNHIYYDGFAREMCLKKRHETYANHPLCPFHCGKV